MLINSIVLFSLAAIGSSLTLPASTDNGVYLAYYNEDGEELLKRIPESALDYMNNSEPAETDNRSLIKKRATGLETAALSKRHDVTWCGCGIHMNTGDTNVATARLKAVVDGGSTVPGGSGGHAGALVAVQNTVVVFLCNWASALTPLSSYATDGPPIVTQACGLFIPGTWRVPGPVALDYGYMNFYSTLDYCGHAEQANTPTC